MKKIKFADYEVSQIMLGCMRLGGKSEAEVNTHIKTALEQGINFFDNADIYYGGVSEEYFGRAIKGVDRDSIVVQTKCGIRKGFYDFSKEHIISGVEGSLRRMGLDYVDVLCLHRPDVLMNGYEVAEAFDELESRGLVRNFGVSNFSPAQTELLKKYVSQPILTNQLQLGLFHSAMIDEWMCVNMNNDFALDRDGGILPYCRLHDMTIQAWGPLRSDNGFFPVDSSLEEENTRLKDWADSFGVTPEALSIAWLMKLDFVQPIIGTTNTDRLVSMLKADSVSLSREQWYNIYSDAGKLIP